MTDTSRCKPSPAQNDSKSTCKSLNCSKLTVNSSLLCSELPSFISEKWLAPCGTSIHSPGHRPIDMQNYLAQSDVETTHLHDGSNKSLSDLSKSTLPNLTKNCTKLEYSPVDLSSVNEYDNWNKSISDRSDFNFSELSRNSSEPPFSPVNLSSINDNYVRDTSSFNLGDSDIVDGRLPQMSLDRSPQNDISVSDDANEMISTLVVSNEDPVHILEQTPQISDDIATPDLSQVKDVEISSTEEF